MSNATGRVKWFSNVKKYGFISADDGRDIFVHFTAILGEGFKTLKEGQSVEFEVVDGPKGARAANVKKVSEPPAPSNANAPKPNDVRNSVNQS